MSSYPDKKCHRCHKKCYGYTLQELMKMFIEEIEGVEKNG